MQADQFASQHSKGGQNLGASGTRPKPPSGHADQFAAAGMAWWNALSEPERRAALEAAGPDSSAATAYRLRLERCGFDFARPLTEADAARLVLFPRLVEALAQQRCCVCNYMLHEDAPECSMCREDRQVLAEARKLT